MRAAAFEGLLVKAALRISGRTSRLISSMQPHPDRALILRASPSPKLSHHYPGLRILVAQYFRIRSETCSRSAAHMNFRPCLLGDTGRLKRTFLPESWREMATRYDWMG